jgi:hypothetical protein
MWMLKCNPLNKMELGCTCCEIDLITEILYINNMYGAKLEDHVKAVI